MKIENKSKNDIKIKMKEKPRPFRAGFNFKRKLRIKSTKYLLLTWIWEILWIMKNISLSVISAIHRLLSELTGPGGPIGKII